MVLGLLALLGVALRVAPWFRAHRFRGVQEYDDGVYYASGRLLLRGLAPYRDFVILHPPGIALAMTPFALLGDLTSDPTGLAAARVAVLLVGCLNLLLVHRIATTVMPASTWGPLLAAAAYAVCPVVVVSERTVLLEPFVTALCLAAVLRLAGPEVTARGDLLAGLLVGAAVSVKLFAGTYLLAVVLVLASTGQVRRAGRVVVGTVAALVVTCLPFLVLAPRALVHDVVATQLERPLSGLRGVPRLTNMVGGARAPHLLVVAVLVVGLVAVCVAVLRARPGQRSTQLVLLTTAGLTAAAFLTAHTYYPHYGAFLVPPVAVLVAWTCHRAERPALRGAVAGGVALLLGFYLVGSVRDAAQLGARPDLSAVRGEVAGGCVFWEDVSLAVAADVLAAPTAACPSWIDGRGVIYTDSGAYSGRSDFYYRGFTGNASWQGQLHDQLAHADFLLLEHAPALVNEWSSANKAYVAQQFQLDRRVVASRSTAQLWKRVVPAA